MNSIKKSNIIFISFILLITFFSFLPILENDFVDWDDYSYIIQNYKIRELSLSKIKEIFTTTHYGGYEPLTELSFTLIYSFAKLNPFYYHLVNLILHLINVTLVFYLFFLLTNDNKIAFIVTILFAIHPLRVESVAWASELKDVLYALFFLCSLIFYIYYYTKKEKNIYFYILSVLFYAISLLPKPQAIFLPFLLFVFDYYNNRKFEKNLFFEKVPYFAVFILFFVTTILGYRSYNSYIGKEFSLKSVNILNGTYSFLFYIFKTFLPSSLSNIYPHPRLISNFHYFFYLISPAIFIVVSIFVIATVKRERKILFGFLFYGINIAIVSQIITTGPAIVADRYSYISLVGIFYIIAEFIIWVYNKYVSGRKKLFKHLFFSTCFLVLFILSFITFKRATVWKDSFTLWSDVYKKYPNSVDALKGLGTYYLDKREYEKAKDFFEKSIKIEPSAIAYVNLGIISDREEDYQKALSYYQQALDSNPDVYYYANIYLNIGVTYYRLKDFKNAKEYFLKSIEVNPNNELTYLNLAVLEIERKDLLGAISYFEKALSLNPENLNIYLALIKLNSESGRYIEAKEIYRKAIERFPDNAVLEKYRRLYIENKK